MAIEIERKFIIDTSKLPELKNGLKVRQSYLQFSGRPTGNTVVRARLTGDKAWLAIKSGNTDLSRLEYEYEIPVNDASDIIEKLCSKSIIEKTRYLLEHGEHTWEIDIFEGDNKGLNIAELELSHEDEVVDIPDWAAIEVTGDSRYYNSNLLLMPYKNWPMNSRVRKS